MLFTNTEHDNFAKDPAVVSFQGRYLLYHSVRDSDGRFGIGIGYLSPTGIHTGK
ncbi:MAG: hypothetical protein K6E19_06175 [Lachnospiraceae bacterium]|nr:hypothetical protein [Lachnospiraceae bacterium]